MDATLELVLYDTRICPINVLIEFGSGHGPLYGTNNIEQCSIKPQNSE